MKKPETFLRERVGYYWVLSEYGSKSSPGKKHEVRTSQRDGKTYCTCRGWIVALNAGHSICTHIRQYKQSKPAVVVAVMNKEDFASFRRGITLSDSTIETNPVIRR